MTTSKSQGPATSVVARPVYRRFGAQRPGSSVSCMARCFRKNRQPAGVARWPRAKGVQRGLVVLLLPMRFHAAAANRSVK